ncbi:NADH dehydrogenase subunit 3 (mitochondrion) [Ramazzottius varieornatus]|uniref:NADH-ubiquinone oxidoreductase chain 3 n=1 Tax=Ramazzottius varieornatus TaxID=947166 RepID=A0A1C9ZP23_RAMVA|nr:NADH dehydrogenase subunit 3 [Ramazzottius varieornatus]BAV58166.1 NADH dehydrogenase subunit 3 [Ramazzottius varieornatus]
MMIPTFSLIAIIIILMALSYVMKTQNRVKWQEKMSNFECGFDSNHTNRMAFSLRFFIITVIFLVFDIEIAVILPSPMVEESLSIKSSTMINWSFFTLLLGGLIFEWQQGALEWS